MKVRIYLLLLVCGAFLTDVASGADRFPKQPNISGALDKLNAAQENLVRVRLKDRPHKNLTNAAVNLAAAATFLEEAAKNKGSYPNAARRSIGTALEEVEKARTDLGRAEEAAKYVREAIDKTMRAGKTGRR